MFEFKVTEFEGSITSTMAFDGGYYVVNFMPDYKLAPVCNWTVL